MSELVRDARQLSPSARRPFGCARWPGWWRAGHARMLPRCSRSRSRPWTSGGRSGWQAGARHSWPSRAGVGSASTRCSIEVKKLSVTTSAITGQSSMDEVSGKPGVTHWPGRWIHLHVPGVLVLVGLGQVRIGVGTSRWQVRSSSGPFTAAPVSATASAVESGVAMVSNLPFGLSVDGHRVFTGPPDPRQHPFGFGQCPYSAGCARRPAEAPTTSPGFLLPFGCRPWLLGSSCAR